MEEELQEKDFELIVEALGYSKMHIENYAHYPSYELKLSRMAQVESTLRKIKALRRRSNIARN